MSSSVLAVGVVVPANDEEELLPSALDHVLRAIHRLAEVGGPPVDLVVVADACSDATPEVARAGGVRVVETTRRAVGAARAAGVSDVLGRLPGVDPARIWLATTDADSRVPLDWLTHMVDLADGGADLVLGTVDVRDWAGHPDHVERFWRSAYDGRDGHGHVHGANVGARADAYLEIGGFADVDRDEDLALAGALRHRTVVRTGRVPVVTSARSVGRAVGGFADQLRRLGGYAGSAPMGHKPSSAEPPTTRVRPRASCPPPG